MQSRLWLWQFSILLFATGSAAMNIGVVRLKVAGCGHSLDYELESSAKVGDVLDKTAAAMGVSRHHIKMLYRGKQIGNGNEGVSLDAAGIRDRTKLMLMYTALYHEEAEKIQSQTASGVPRDRPTRFAVAGSSRIWDDRSTPWIRRARATANCALSHPSRRLRFPRNRPPTPRHRRIMCKLDGIDTAGSEWLRAKRKAEIQRIEKLSAA